MPSQKEGPTVLHETARRIAWADRYRSLAAQRPTGPPELLAEVAEAEASFDASRAAFSDAQTRLRVARSAVTSWTAQVDRDMCLLASDLRETADPAIAHEMEGLRDLRDLLAANRASQSAEYGEVAGDLPSSHRGKAMSIALDGIQELEQMQLLGPVDASEPLAVFRATLRKRFAVLAKGA